MELLLIRHGQAQRHDTSSDPDLSDLGRKQAELLARWYAGHAIERVISSPMRRALQTATPLAEGLGCEIERLDGLAEFDISGSSYTPEEEIDPEDPLFRQMMLHGTFPDEGYLESPPEFRARVIETIERIVADHPGETVAVVCHGGVVNNYVGHVLGVERHFFFEPANTGVSRVAASRSGIRTMLSVNETGHLHVVKASQAGPPSPLRGVPCPSHPTGST